MSRAALPRTLPLLALTLVALGIALELAPAFHRVVRWERAAIAQGELWRLLTGHMVHGSTGFAALDLFVLGVLGAWWEQRSRAKLAAILVTSALATSLVLLACTTLELYRGSSALSSGLFVAAGVELARSRTGAARFLGRTALVCFAAKCALEWSSRQPLGWVELPEGTHVAVSAHLAGGSSGLLCVLCGRLLAHRKGRKELPCPSPSCSRTTS